MSAVMTIPVAGTAREKILQGSTADVVKLPVRVRRARLESNDFNHSDSLMIECEGMDVGVDPRFLSSATVEFYLGNAAASGDWQPSSKDLRFIGVMTRPARFIDENEGYRVSVEFQDYTALFLECDKTKFPPSGIPEIGETIEEAWARICDHVGIVNGDGSVYSTVSALRDRIRFSPDIAGNVPKIGDAMIKRLRTSGKIQVKHGSDAWAVWQQCIGQLGLISYIKGDTCIVSSTTDYYTESNPPVMVWGRNILSMAEERNALMSSKGVGVISFDPLTNTTLEAVWPIQLSSVEAKKRVIASKASNGAVIAADRVYYNYPSVTNPERLQMIAERIYEERSRQELEGRIVTREMSVKSANGDDFDMLSLTAGDVIRVEADPDSRLYLRSVGSTNEQSAYLISRGYSRSVADLIARNMSSIQALPSTYFVKAVNTMLETDGDSGNFQIDVNYMNRISIDGAASI